MGGVSFVQRGILVASSSLPRAPFPSISVEPIRDIPGLWVLGVGMCVVFLKDDKEFLSVKKRMCINFEDGEMFRGPVCGIAICSFRRNICAFRNCEGHSVE